MGHESVAVGGGVFVALGVGVLVGVGVFVSVGVGVGGITLHLSAEHTTPAWRHFASTHLPVGLL